MTGELQVPWKSHNAVDETILLSVIFASEGLQYFPFDYAIIVSRQPDLNAKSLENELDI